MRRGRTGLFAGPALAAGALAATPAYALAPQPPQPVHAAPRESHEAQQPVRSPRPSDATRHAAQTAPGSQRAEAGRQSARHATRQAPGVPGEPGARSTRHGARTPTGSQAEQKGRTAQHAAQAAAGSHDRPGTRPAQRPQPAQSNQPNQPNQSAQSAHRPQPAESAQAPQTADLRLVYDGPGTASGDGVIWRWRLRNEGSGAAEDIVTTQRIRSGHRLLAVSKPCELARDTIICRYDALGAGDEHAGWVKTAGSLKNGPLRVDAKMTWRERRLQDTSSGAGADTRPHHPGH